MSSKRIFRDLCIMAALCGTFYVSTLVVGKLERNDSPRERSFSTDRRQAEKFLEKGDWNSAATHFQALTEQDPFNGYAFYKLAISYLRLRFDAREQIEELPASETNQGELELLQKQFDQYEQSAISTLSKSREFLRYRRDSLFHLSIVHSERREWEEALECLDEFVSQGYWLYNGLANVDRLGTGGRSMVKAEAEVTVKTRLHRFPEFWEIIERENVLREDNIGLRLRFRP